MNIYDTFGYETPSEIFQHSLISQARIEKTKVPQLLAPQIIHDRLQQQGKRYKISRIGIHYDQSFIKINLKKGNKPRNILDMSNKSLCLMIVPFYLKLKNLTNIYYSLFL